MDIKNLYKNGKPTEIFAFYGPSDGKYQNGKPMGDGTDFRIKERYQEYKDCGFDVLLLENEATYNGEPFETSKIKEIMDICAEIGLKVIVLDRRIYDLAVFGYQNKTIDGITINTQDDLVKLISLYIKDYSKHPAFMGVYITDEPPAELLDGVSSIIGALKTAKPDCYVHICNTSSGALYRKNDEYIKRDKWGEITCDIYLFEYYETLKNPKLERTFFLWMEKIKRLTQKHGIGFSMVSLQCFGGGEYNGCTAIGWRPVDIYDMRYQAYASMMFYPTHLVWFHYWASRYTAPGLNTCSIMDEYGRKRLYNEAKEINAEIKSLTKVMNHFDYRGVNVVYDKKSNPYYFLNERNYVFADMSVEKIKGAAVISEGRDEKNQLSGFTVLNSTPPDKRKSATITFDFKNSDEIVVYKRGVPVTVRLKDGKYKIKLPCGEGVFIIPVPKK